MKNPATLSRTFGAGAGTAPKIAGLKKAEKFANVWLREHEEVRSGTCF